MPEETLFETEQAQTRNAIASYLHTVADKLDSGEPIALSSGGKSVTLDPPERPTFEVKVEREGPEDAEGELSIEFEIEWEEGADGDGGDLRIA